MTAPKYRAPVAQLIEQVFCKPQVAGSMPAGRSKYARRLFRRMHFGSGFDSRQFHQTGSGPNQRKRVHRPFSNKSSPVDYLIWFGGAVQVSTGC